MGRTSVPRRPSQSPPGPKERSPTETESPDCRQGLRLSQSESDSPRGNQGGRWSRNSHYALGHLPQRLVFGIECRTSLTFSPLVEPAGHLCRRLTSAHRAGYLISHRLRSRLFTRILSRMPVGIGGRHLGVDAARAFRTAPEKFSTQVSIAISLCNSRSNGTRTSK